MGDASVQTNAAWTGGTLIRTGSIANQSTHLLAWPAARASKRTATNTASDALTAATSATVSALETVGHDHIRHDDVSQ